MNNIKRLTPTQWHSRTTAINNKNLKQWHTTNSLVNEKMNECITMFVDDLIEIDEKKYKKLRQLCITEDFVRNTSNYDFERIKIIKTIK